MKTPWTILICCLVGLAIAAEEEEAIQYLARLEPLYSAACNEQIEARWAYVTNVTAETEQKSSEAQTAFYKYQASVQSEILARFPPSEWNPWSSIVKRELKYLSIQGPAGMPEEDVQKMNDLLGKMETAYAEATVCEYLNPTKCDLTLEPDIEAKLRNTTDYDELAHYWTSWHDAMSASVSPSDYTQFIAYQNQMAAANGYRDMSDLWLQPYDDGTVGWTAADFKEEMLEIWNALRPYYQKLHAFVRMQLKKSPEYASKFKRFSYLPAHLMGNMWSQEWGHLEQRTKPFPSAPSLDATEAMRKANYTVQKMFEVADEFFQDFGLENMTATFWEKSMLEKPEDGRKVICHASAEDMCTGAGNEDFRIKMCTNVDMDDLVTVHHEMGHIEYFWQYRDLHYIFRNGANPGFHEAIGDALALAVTTPKHLECVLGLELELGLECEASNPVIPNDIDINFLYKMALDKFAFFPFAISMDSWRWEVLEGKIPESEYNSRWWEIRKENQGIVPPEPRADDKFDPAAKYHIVGNVEYIRYFVSAILQFQFYEEMCTISGQYDPNNPELPLHHCDFSGNKTAGELFGEMMKLGFSKPWPEALSLLTKGKGMSADSLLNYFKPLFDVLDERLNEANELPCFGKYCEEFAEEYIHGKYEASASALCQNASLARWAYQTDLNNATAESLSEAASLAQSIFREKEWKEVFSEMDHELFDATGSTQRQLKFLNAVGTSALPQEKLEQFNKVLSNMSKTYGTARVCPFTKQNCNLTAEGLSLEPDLENVLATSTNYDELAYYWKQWRDKSGKLMRADYNTYVDLNNEAAELNGFDDASQFWVFRYESNTFKEDMEKLWEDVKEIYEDLHAYVRHRLGVIYPQMGSDNPLPSHVLGNMWAQTWGNIYEHVLPYPDASQFDVTQALREAFPDNETAAMGMFSVANGFFTGLGLEPMTMAFGPKAMIRKPLGKEVICHASAWDFCDKEDFRVKMCTNTDMEDFITIHHELGHIQYYLQYKNLPITFRGGANPGFHEAIGDVVALSVATPAHMKKLGLIKDEDDIGTPESTINYLMKIALDKIAFLPFGFLIDSYRWKIFDGQIPRENFTYEWLKMSMEYQGIHPPFKRSELDFDPGAKYHVPADTPYIRYFVSHILQFQIHMELCKEAGLYPAKPLHECDIDKSKEAGAKFKALLQSGASVNWETLLEQITGQRKLNASALLEYFLPLQTFLKTRESELKYPRGWDSSSFEDYFEDEGQVTDEPTEPTTSAPTSVPPEKQEEGGDSDNGVETAAIIVGIVLGAAVVVVTVAYFIGSRIRRR